MNFEQRIQEFQQEHLQDALQIFEMRRQSGDRPSEAEGLISMADFYNRLGKYTQAQRLIEQTLAIVQETSLHQQPRLQSIEAEALKLLGIVYFWQGNFAKAQETAQTALAMQKQLGDRIGEGATLIVVSAALIQLGQHSEAKEALEESLKALKEPSSSLDEQKCRRFYEGEALAWMGNIEMISGNVERAIKILEQALVVNRETGNRSYGELNTLCFIAALHSRQGELDKTLKSYQQLLSLSREIGHRLYEGIALILIGKVYQVQEQNDRALASYQQALEVFKEIGDLQKEAETIVAIADIYAKQEQSQRLSLEHYEQALTIFRDLSKVSGGDPDIRLDTAIGSLSSSIGVIYTSLGRYPEGQEYFSQSLTLLQSLLAKARANNNREMESLILKNLLVACGGLGNNYAAQQQHRQAIDYCQKALDLARHLGDREREKRFLGQLVVSYSNQGLAYKARRDYEDALESFQQALKIAKENGFQDWEVNMLCYIGQNYTSRQDFAQALSYQKQALAIAQQRNDRSKQIQSLSALGNVYKKLSRYEDALKVYQQAYDLSQGESDRKREVSLLVGIGTIYDYQKQYDLALNAYRQAKETTQNNPLTPFVTNGIDANNVEEFYSVVQQYKSNSDTVISPLRDTCTDALDALAYFGSDVLKHQFVLDSLNDLAKGANQTFLTLKGLILHAMGQLYFKQEKYSQALEYYQQALPILNEAKAVIEGATLADLGIIYMLQGQYDQALKYSQHGLKISRSFNHRINEEDALYNLAIVYWAQENLLSALETLSEKVKVETETLPLNLAIGSEKHKREFILGKSRSIDIIVTFHLQAAPQNLEAARLALSTVLQHKGRILDVISNNVQKLRQNLQPEDKILWDELSSSCNRLVDLLYDKQNSLLAEEFKTQVATLQAKIEELEDTLAQRSIEFRTEVQSVKIEVVQALIPADAALLEFVWYKPFNPKASRISEAWKNPRYAAAIITHQGNPKWVDLGEAAPIEEAVKQFRDNLRNRQNQFSDIREKGQALYNLLISKIQVVLVNIRHLLIAPDSQLNLVPFAALVNPQNQYLVEIYNITYLTSGRDLLRLQPKRSDCSYQQNSVIIANVNELSGTHIEAETIAPFLPKAILLKDSQANKETLKQLHAPFILHIATHGFFESNDNSSLNNENPLLRSYLKFAGDKKNNILTALEVAGLNLHGTHLVVLSACETGLGDVLNGEGVYGLRRAFVIAGAESQMVSLWKVDDLSTAFLMIRFYENLQSGLAVSLALNQAQLWLNNLTKGNLEKWIEEKQLPLDSTMRMNLRRRFYKLEDDTKPFKSPFYWAAFCAISQ